MILVKYIGVYFGCVPKLKGTVREFYLLFWFLGNF